MTTYWVRSTYGITATFNNLKAAKEYAYRIIADAPTYSRPQIAWVEQDSKRIYEVIRNGNSIKDSTKELSLILSDKARSKITTTWPFEYYYAPAGKKPAKMKGTQYLNIAVYYVAKDIRNGEYKEGIIYKGARKTKEATVRAINKSTFEVTAKVNGKPKPRIMTWAEISNKVKDF